MITRAQILIRPIFLIAIALLLINDHFLKTLYPSWLTGKLSDLAGLFVFGVFTYVLIGGHYKTKKSLLIVHFIIGVAFVIWKLAPIEMIFQKLQEIVNFPLPSRVKDPLDLIALPVLFMSYLYILNHKFNYNLIIKRVTLYKIFVIFILMLSCFSILATSYIRTFNMKTNVAINHPVPAAEVLFAFEQHLEEKGFKVLARNNLDSLYIFRTTTNYSQRHYDKYGEWYSEGDYLVDFTLGLGNNNIISILSVDAKALNRYPEVLKETIVNEIIKPFKLKYDTKNEKNNNHNTD